MREYDKERDSASRGCPKRLEGSPWITSDRTHRGVLKVWLCAGVNVLQHVYVKLWEIRWGQEWLRNIRWLTEDGSPLWRFHTHAHSHTPDYITQVEDLPCALAIRFSAASMCMCDCVLMWTPNRAMWCVQQYQLEVNISPFLKLEFRISLCWAERETSESS